MGLDGCPQVLEAREPIFLIVATIIIFEVDVQSVHGMASKNYYSPSGPTASRTAPGSAATSPNGLPTGSRPTSPGLPAAIRLL